MGHTQIPFKLFRSFFYPFIRVQLNWEKLESEDVTVTMGILDEFQHPSRWYLPWYLNDRSEEVSYLAENAHPLTLSDIPKAVISLRDGRRDKIQRLLNEFVSLGQQPPQVLIASYNLSNSQHLILDGNHRASGIVLGEIRAKLMIFEINGSLDMEILPDLFHWQDSNS